MRLKGFDQYRYRKSPAIRSFNMVFRFSTAILRMAQARAFAAPIRTHIFLRA